MNILYEKFMFLVFIVALLIVIYGLYDTWFVYNKAKDDSYHVAVDREPAELDVPGLEQDWQSLFPRLSTHSADMAYLIFNHAMKYYEMIIIDYQSLFAKDAFGLSLKIALLICGLTFPISYEMKR